MFGFSAGEILLITAIALILFGNEKLPQNIKKFIGGWNYFRKSTQDIQNSWYEIKYDVQNLVENTEEKSTEQIKVKPVNNIVSQEEIDEHHHKIESSYNASSS